MTTSFRDWLYARLYDETWNRELGAGSPVDTEDHAWFVGGRPSKPSEPSKGGEPCN